MIFGHFSLGYLEVNEMATDNVALALATAVKLYQQAQIQAQHAQKEAEELKIKQMMLQKAMQPSELEKAQLAKTNQELLTDLLDKKLKFDTLQLEKLSTVQDYLNTDAGKTMSVDNTRAYVKKVLGENWDVELFKSGFAHKEERPIEVSPTINPYDRLLNPPKKEVPTLNVPTKAARGYEDLGLK